LTIGNSLHPRSLTRTCKVNLINPPSAPGTTANREGAAGMGVVYPHEGAFLYPPHTLATVAATLRDAGYEVQASDAVVEGLPPDVAKADAIGVFVSYASLDTDVAFLAALRSQTSATLIALGPAMRFVGEQVLDHAPADAVLVGEAEGFFAAALRHLDEERGSPSPQLLTPEVVHASGYDTQGLIQDLDALPFPAWEQLPYEKYDLLTVLASRGCPDQCAYCPYAAAQGHRFRTRSVENVLAELAWLDRRFHPARLVFRDPVFAYNRDRVVEICTGMLRRELHLHWECESRPEHFDADLLRLMQRAGCQWVKMGLETTDEALLQKLKRVASAAEAVEYAQHVADVVRTCSDLGLYIRLFVMAGLPGQDVAAAQSTRHFVEQLGPTALNIKLYEKYPGIQLDSSADRDHEAQMEVLCQAQATLQGRQSSPSLLARKKRWLRRAWRGGNHGRQ
jgi:anaerobic magnesium-protoporphyrin IX monomethyl ester cyclase